MHRQLCPTYSKDCRCATRDEDILIQTECHSRHSSAALESLAKGFEVVGTAAFLFVFPEQKHSFAFPISSFDPAAVHNRFTGPHCQSAHSSFRRRKSWIRR